jgi:release factor glutamine methyltransferase
MMSSGTQSRSGSGRVRVRALPGVWPPHSDARLLAQVVSQTRLATGKDVLEVFAGSGALALSMAVDGARSVTAVDISRRALLSIRLNARRNNVRIRTLRGDLFAPLLGESFDLIVANPPYVPGQESLPTRGIARAWEGGLDGRILVDRLLTDAPRHLRRGGSLIVIHSSMTGERETCAGLRAAGLRTEVLMRHRGPLGPIGRARAGVLRERGLLDDREASEEEEDLVVICGTREALTP